jgi:hypothetical protein
MNLKKSIFLVLSIVSLNSLIFASAEKKVTKEMIGEKAYDNKEDAVKNGVVFCEPPPDNDENRKEGVIYCDIHLFKKGDIVVGERSSKEPGNPPNYKYAEVEGLTFIASMPKVQLNFGDAFKSPRFEHIGILPQDVATFLKRITKTK